MAERQTAAESMSGNFWRASAGRAKARGPQDPTDAMLTVAALSVDDEDYEPPVGSPTWHIVHWIEGMRMTESTPIPGRCGARFWSFKEYHYCTLPKGHDRDQHYDGSRDPGFWSARIQQKDANP